MCDNNIITSVPPLPLLIPVYYYISLYFVQLATEYPPEM